jgi:hypothetical protein
MKAMDSAVICSLIEEDFYLIQVGAELNAIANQR